jgi:glycosyltransferase involved in cell wall biosynthesis
VGRSPGLPAAARREKRSRSHHAGELAPFKRHIRFFKCLSRLRARGHRPSVLLVGYPYQTTTEQIWQEAKYFGISDQIQIKENLSPEEVNVELNRSRINVLWSRREGVNRAIIEGMFAGVPCIVRDGFNYGYHYPYINDSTGCYATEDGLPDRILQMLEPSAAMRPRDWVMANMTCQLATRIIAEAVKGEALAAGEPWREDLAVKVSRLTSMRYWDDDDRARFAADYEYLASCLS